MHLESYLCKKSSNDNLAIAKVIAIIYLTNYLFVRDNYNRFSYQGFILELLLNFTTANKYLFLFLNAT